MLKEKLREYLERVLEFPKEIHLESSSRCNSRCMICPRDKMKRELGELDRSLFNKAVEECASYKMDYIHLHLNGEPLLLGIDEVISRANYTKDINLSTDVCMFTNGSLLDEVASDKILESRLDTIVISVDGGNKEDYEKNRRGLNWDTLIKNVTYLVRRKRELGKKMRIWAAIVPTTLNKDSIRQYFETFYAIGVDHCAGSGIQNIGGLIDSNSLRLPTQRYVATDIDSPCWRVFLDLSIMSDGRACVCCQDVIGAFPVGDLRTQSLKEIWQGSVMTEVRDKFVNGKKKDIVFCGECDFMTGFDLPDYWKVPLEYWKEIYEEVKSRKFGNK